MDESHTGTKARAVCHFSTNLIIHCSVTKQLHNGKDSKYWILDEMQCIMQFLRPGKKVYNEGFCKILDYVQLQLSFLISNLFKILAFYNICTGTMVWLWLRSMSVLGLVNGGVNYKIPSELSGGISFALQYAQR